MIGFSISTMGLPEYWFQHEELVHVNLMNHTTYHLGADIEVAWRNNFRGLSGPMHDMPRMSVGYLELSRVSSEAFNTMVTRPRR